MPMLDRDRFKSRVVAYQKYADEWIIYKVLDYMRIKFHLMRRGFDFEEHGMYIAFRINMILLGKMKAAKYKRQSTSYDPEDLPSYRKAIKDDLGIDIFSEPDFGSLMTHNKQILSYLGGEQFASLCEAIRRYREHLVASSDAIEEAVAELEPALIIPALKYAFSCVDTSRSEKEMVRYINRAFATEYIRLQLKQTGTRRLGRRDESGRYRNIYVTPSEPNAWEIVFAPGVTARMAEQRMARLTKAQRQRIQKVYDIVTEDIRTGNMARYKVDDRGSYRINFRYLAERLGIEESTLRKSLSKARAA
ncbi:hypothetical protein DCC85_14370 [Paenibacillus sp. CAA11]|uniref:hypothetical protein n=1 Tax=Paenibacillus sp. CAA11 TaxID=1532905 RepID=UPI000D345E76|nr:hypothetical protein [Paenibacillus sp. CAA11]AWB45294.1 hypothetical protein DCC85_14370 [Paenibacillus sp. CAA11]